MEYYRVLDLEPKLALDTNALQKRFYELSRKWHPDRFTTSPHAQQAEALEKTALINDAFRTLRDPVLRGEYVLSQNSLEASGQRGHDVPVTLLEEVLELNEALAEADKGQIERLLPQFRSTLDAIDSKLQEQFSAWDAAPSADTLKPIRATLNQRKYIANLVRDAERALDR
jgi:molecular chaperone HscB